MDTIVRSAVQVRQGDILLVPCAQIPCTASELAAEEGRVVLARGETTGHAHAMAADRVRYFREDGTGQAYIRVESDGPVALAHEEHSSLLVGPGEYRVIQQREYEPAARPRLVHD
jgi:hypothetical protein